MLQCSAVRTIIPKNARLVPKEATCVFEGKIFSVWQWQQKMYDGSFETFEMLKRPDIVVIVAVKDGKIVILDQEQPNAKPFRDFPGGRHDVDTETEREAAQREMCEETGMTFRTWKLIDVRQLLPKIENFMYTFLATDFEKQEAQKLDPGEKIEIETLNFDKFKKLVKTSGFRSQARVMDEVKSLDELLALPEYSEAS